MFGGIGMQLLYAVFLLDNKVYNHEKIVNKCISRSFTVPVCKPQETVIGI